MDEEQLLAKRYLERSKDLAKKIEVLQMQREEYMLRATNITVPLNPVKVQTSKNPDKIADAIIHAVDIDEVLNRTIDEYHETQEQHMIQIQELSNLKQMQVLFKVFIMGKTIKEAAREMDVSGSYGQEMFEAGLKEFARLHADMLRSAFQNK